jgi:phasin family protein
MAKAVKAVKVAPKKVVMAKAVKAVKAAPKKVVKAKVVKNVKVQKESNYNASQANNTKIHADHKEAHANHNKSHTNQKDSYANHQQAKKEKPTMDILKTFVQQGKAMMDRDSIINNHRKNLEAMNEASKTAMDLLKSVTTLQNQYVRQSFEDLSTMMQDMMQKPQAPEQWEKQASRFKESVTKAIDHTSNVANIVVKTNSDFYKKAQNQAKDVFQEMKFATAKKK